MNEIIRRSIARLYTAGSIDDSALDNAIAKGYITANDKVTFTVDRQSPPTTT